MRLFQKIFLPFVIACFWLLPAIEAGMPPQQVGSAVTSFNNCNNTVASHLNKDAEQPLPARYTGNTGQHNGQSSIGKIFQPFFLPGTGCVAIAHRAVLSVWHTGRVHDFVPLLRLLLYPKHWFW